MKLFAIPANVSLVIFDVDNTLYRHDAYVAFQTDALVARLGQELRVNTAAMGETIEAYRRFCVETGGARPTLAASFEAFGIPIEKSIEWRSQLFHPEEYLQVDTRLVDMVQSMERVHLSVVSNNPVHIVERTLACLGVAGFFAPIVGIDTCMKAKPDPCGYQVAMDAHGVPAAESLVVGDRFEVDLLPVLDKGGGGILLEAEDDLYSVAAAIA